MQRFWQNMRDSGVLNMRGKTRGECEHFPFVCRIFAEVPVFLVKMRINMPHIYTDIAYAEKIAENAARQRNLFKMRSHMRSHNRIKLTAL